MTSCSSLSLASNHFDTVRASMERKEAKHDYIILKKKVDGSYNIGVGEKKDRASLSLINEFADNLLKSSLKGTNEEVTKLKNALSVISKEFAKEKTNGFFKTIFYLITFQFLITWSLESKVKNLDKLILPIIKPTIPEDSKSDVPEPDKPDVPELEKPHVPEAGRPPVPEVSTTPIPEVSKPPVPKPDKAPVSEVSTTPIPEVSKPPVPKPDKAPVSEVSTPHIPEASNPPVSESSKSSILPKRKAPLPPLRKPTVSQSSKSSILPKRKAPLPPSSKPFVSESSIPTVSISSNTLIPESDSSDSKNNPSDPRNNPKLLKKLEDEWNRDKKRQNDVLKEIALDACPLIKQYLINQKANNALSSSPQARRYITVGQEANANALSLPPQLREISLGQEATENDFFPEGAKIEELKVTDLIIAETASKKYQYAQVLKIDLKKNQVVLIVENEIFESPITSLHQPKSRPFLKPIPEKNEFGNLEKDHTKSFIMFKFLEHVEGYDRERACLEIKTGKETKEYSPVTGKTLSFSEKPLASCGSSPAREILTLEPNSTSSPDAFILNTHYTLIKYKLIKAIEASGEKNEEALLKILVKYILESVFPKKNNMGELVNTLIQNHLKNEKSAKISFKYGGQSAELAVMPIALFLKKKVALCRHHTLLLCYLLDRLIKEGIFGGSIQYMRHEDGDSAHAWACLTTEKSKWHLDSFWNVIEDLNTDSGKEAIKTIYSQDVLDFELRRLG